MTRSAVWPSHWKPVALLAVAALMLLVDASRSRRRPRRKPPVANRPTRSRRSRNSPGSSSSSRTASRNSTSGSRSSTAAVDRWTNVERARKEIEELRALVGTALGAVSDNGFGLAARRASALAHAREKLRMLEQDHALPSGGAAVPDRAVARLRIETERANEELSARAQGIRRPAADAAGQRGLRRGTRADPPGAEGAGSDPAPDPGHPRSQRPAQELIGGIKPPGA